MAVTKKIDIEAQKREADAQVDDIMSMISGLGSKPAAATVVKEEEEEPAPVYTSTSTRTRSSINDVQTGARKRVAPVEIPDEKPGYISMVIPTSLKKKWKIFCTQHGMSLTDALKLGMKLLEDMEQNREISIEDGIVSYNR